MEQALSDIIAFFSGFPEWSLCLLLIALALLQYVFPPVPSDTLLVALGILVSQGVFHHIYGFVSYAAGAVAGALGLFYLSYFLGDKVRNIKFVKVHISEKSFEKAHKVIGKYGGASYFILRFVPSMQCITIIVMGLSKTEKKKSVIYISAVTVFACLVYYLLGYLLGSNIPKLLSVLDALGTAGWIILAAAAVAALAGFIIYKIASNRKNGG